jgi:hypothetical protein
MTSAFDLQLAIANFIKTNGTVALTENQLFKWGLAKQQDGTYIGYTPMEDGTLGVLSAGTLITGTQCPTKFGVEVKIGEMKISVFDWNQQGKNVAPHFQFYDQPRKRYFLDDASDYRHSVKKLEALKSQVGTSR